MHREDFYENRTQFNHSLMKLTIHSRNSFPWCAMRENTMQIHTFQLILSSKNFLFKDNNFFDLMVLEPNQLDHGPVQEAHWLYIGEKKKQRKKKLLTCNLVLVFSDGWLIL